MTTNAITSSQTGMAQLLEDPPNDYDLQKGERYTSMDYAFSSAISSIALLPIMATYDTGCKVHIAEQTQSTIAFTDGEQIEHMWSHVNPMVLDRATGGAHQRETLDRVDQLDGILSTKLRDTFVKDAGLN